LKWTHRLVVLIQALPAGDNPSSKEMQMTPEQLNAQHLTQRDLARRWNKAVGTIERYRADGKGPRFLKIGGKCLYRLEDVVEYENNCLYDSPFAKARQGGAA
jgi:hypothetical protein